jgi:glycosyltransferase involved in cell wall biosynthesis
MKFSVVIPVFNAAGTLKKVLSSVKNQTCQDFEVILVDDGSKDKSVDIINEFISQNSNLTIKLISTPNNGVSKARNIGLKNSGGAYIALLDSDDCWHPQKLEIMSSLLSDDYSIFSHGAVLDNFIDISAELKTRAVDFTDVLLKNRFVTPSVIFKNDTSILFDEKMRYAEDHDLWLRMVHKKPALYLDFPLVKLNRAVLSKGGASEARWKMRKGEIKMYYNSTKYSVRCKVLFPVLVIFSLVKHLKGKLK